MAKGYNAQAYWDAALAPEFRLGNIGMPSIPDSLNRQFYRSMKHVTTGAVERLGLAGRLGDAAVLDAGSGVGVWLDYWHRLGVGHLTGLDITAEGFDRLHAVYPGIELVRADLGEPGLPLERRYNVVSAMNMLLHIVDDDRWRQAIANLADVLAPGGILLVLDAIVVERLRTPGYEEAPIERWRTFPEWEDAIRASGLEVVSLEPATILLLAPIDTRRRWTFEALWFYWRALIKLFYRRERAGEIAGWPLYALDRLLLPLVKPGPSSKLLVARKPL